MTPGTDAPTDATDAAGEDGGTLPGIDAPTATDTPPVGGDLLPCDVATLITARCIVCHGATPAVGAHSLVSAPDFRMASMADPSRSVGSVAVERIHATDLNQMPPLPGTPVAAADIAMLENWVTAGMPGGACTVDDPFAAPPNCTSGRTWLFGERGSQDMEPGHACITCHTARRLRLNLTLAGTIYPPPTSPTIATPRSRAPSPSRSPTQQAPSSIS